MMKSLYTCALLLAIFCVVHSATIADDKAKLQEVGEKCAKRFGIQRMPSPKDQNLSQNEKCFISCRLVEGGAMNADGTFNLAFVQHFLHEIKGGSAEQMNKVLSLANECTNTSIAKDMCEHAHTAVNCVIDKIKNYFKNSGWRRNARPEVHDKCLKKIGLTTVPESGWNLTHPEKCFRSCVLTESGSMNTDGTFTEDFITETLIMDIPPSKDTEENKAKIRKIYVDCTKTGFQDKDMCEHGVLASKCVMEKFKTIEFN